MQPLLLYWQLHLHAWLNMHSCLNMHFWLNLHSWLNIVTSEWMWKGCCRHSAFYMLNSGSEKWATQCCVQLETSWHLPRCFKLYLETCMTSAKNCTELESMRETARKQSNDIYNNNRSEGHSCYLWTSRTAEANLWQEEECLFDVKCKNDHNIVYFLL